MNYRLGTFLCLVMIVAIALAQVQQPAGSVSVTGTVSSGGAAATGAAVSGNPVYIAGVGSGNVAPLIVCDTTKVTALSTTTAVVLVAAVAAKTTYVCSWELSSVASAATAVQIIAGTQVTNPCDTGTVTLSSLLQLPITTPTTLIEGSGLGTVLRGTAANQQLCATESIAATSVSLTVHYTQF